MSSDSPGPSLHEPCPCPTILIIEDDYDLRMALRQAIERLGYSVLDAAGAAGATLLGATYPEPIDLVLADLDLPASNGVAVVRWLLLHRPRLRYVFMTGHTEEWLTAMALTDLDGCVLHKPVSVH